ncbi:polar amino acid transport system substrate-binding protein [Streptomyces sp. 1114.5]|uniref:ABC transporter substrate-binding protein n=1 Tax=unclassified Streptomyces TaxID=2593676 RepID=UPI000BCE4418|nr:MULTISPECIES: ABC transporter substrate-binding protein [unclassified Streptomyces]RKT15923.1 polar amino acid transport system substrate-binding protein [Streptomyces sp. 1114.5]SOB82097.1 polar amino acid transport system substrate-binding protein [Streptomyces sp. 1331.2]
MRATTVRRRLLAATALLPVLALAACGSDPKIAGAAGAGGPAATATEDVVSGLAKSETAAALLPEEVRKAGTLTFGSSFGAPPSAFYADQVSKKPAGIDVDFSDAVAKVLGLTVQRQEAAFETILPALDSGKFDVGTGNFGVTTARLKTIDFVTYIDDGQGFAVKKDNTAIQPITDLVQLCGLTVGTGAGTTFETTLNSRRNVCTDAGKKPYEVKAFSESGALLTGLQQGRVDIEMSTINGLRHQAAQEASGTRFLGEFHRLDVGFAFKKGSKLTPAFQAAVNQLIKDGTYERILRKWGVADSAIKESQISPPEHA